jgi:SOS-response transcriptional repressor LexA
VAIPQYAPPRASLAKPGLCSITLRFTQNPTLERPGDMVLVERGLEPHDGDMVIAQIDHSWTMKYFRQRGRQAYLEAANKKYKPF